MSDLRLAPRRRGMLPPIDPASLTRAQAAGKRCAVPNCHARRPERPVGWLLDGRVVRTCGECVVSLSEVAA